MKMMPKQKHGTALCLLCTFSVFLIASGQEQQQWKLIYEEDFSTPLENEGSASTWWLETYDEPFDTIMDDRGDWYKNDYGPDFVTALESFQTFRKEYSFGQDGWLTASFSARDSNMDGAITPEPTLEIETNSDTGRNVLTMNTPSHHGGVIIRNTNPLPEVYRIEYKLTNLEHGGLRDGSIVDSEGNINGYDPNGCKTQHPWGEGSKSSGWTGNASVPYCEWQSVRRGTYAYNGFHFLAIVDFADPAPRNNHFWHYRRKVLMDSFSQHPDRVGDGTGGQVCDANTLTYYDYKDSDSYVTLNMWVSGLPGTWTPNPGGLTGSSQRFITDCNGGIATRGIQSAGELLTPDKMEPGEYYTFAIERNSTGYTLEASGIFARVGYKKYRFFRPFVVDDEPIWHYNVKSSEYNGEFNGDLQQIDWAFGSQTWPDQWPAGSAYPDYFVIGDLYTNVYEGSAAITDIRYFEPDTTGNSCERVSLLLSGNQIDGGAIISMDEYFLYQRTNGNLQLWTGTVQNRGYLFWDNGVSESVEGATYYTILQGNGNLVTWRIAADGSQTEVWQSYTVNSSDQFVFVVECQGMGGGVAIYRGLPTEGGVSIWRQDENEVTTSAPVPSVPTPSVPAPSAPTPSAPAGNNGETTSPSLGPSVVCTEPVLLLRSNETLNVGETRTADAYFLYQDFNGNLELREGTPSTPGRLLWETGESETTIDLYYSTLQSDSNLVTRRITRYEESTIWESGTSSEAGTYTMVLDNCDVKGIAVKDQDGITVWWSDLLPLTKTPTNQPTTLNENGLNKPDSSARTMPSIVLVTLFCLVLVYPQ